MRFVKKSADLSPIRDTVFAIVSLAVRDKKENGDLVTDATIGSLFDEDGKFVAFDSVFDHYNKIDHRVKGAYASSFRGDPAYCETVYQWVTQGADLALKHCVIATPGGSGAVSAGFMSFLEPGESILIPDLGWESYELMARQNNLKAVSYEMFDGDHFNLHSVQKNIETIMEKQDHIVLVLNDPCHNPSGYSMSYEEWSLLIAYLREVSKTHAVILINDIAYIDYSYNLNRSREYMNCFNAFTDNMMAVIAFSCSKALTSYGLRCGAAVIVSPNETAVAETGTAFEKIARSIWSNIPNAAMANFTWVVTDNREAYLSEKQNYIDLLHERSAIFLKEAAECGLPLYPYREGFFITVRIKDNDLVSRVHEALMEQHIYTVITNKGIRIAVCSLPKRKAAGLAAKIMNVMNQVRQEGE
ncbi:MAG: aminotransferase class I/II-fold pyridoxal phosphate-dependent enzyme [Solobacterium sp.]|nr:aminotransferase class I/II-fold pyridoxal phosphate-dependent enzyme [Solobacterium sp.]